MRLPSRTTDSRSEITSRLHSQSRRPRRNKSLPTNRRATRAGNKEFLPAPADKQNKSDKQVETGRCVLAWQIVPATLRDALQTSGDRSEEHTSELQSHSFISYAVFCLKKKQI